MATVPGSFDPYHKWLGIRPEERPINYYRLLGVALFESDADVIANAADRQMAHVRSFQGGQHVAESQRLLNEISTARVCLLHPAKKAAYDEMLRREKAAAEAAGQASSTATNPLAMRAESQARLPSARQPQRRWRQENRSQVAVAGGAVGLVLLAMLFLALRGPKEPAVKGEPEQPSVAVAPQPPEPAQPVAPGPPPMAVAPFSTEEAKKHQERWAAHRRVPVEQTNSIGMKLILIPPGEFDMGSSSEEVDRFRQEQKARGIDEKAVQVYIGAMLNAEGPRHRVRITQPFYLGVCEVTQSQWVAVETKNCSYFRGPPLDEDPSQRPVEKPRWDEAAEFCKKLSAMPEEVAAKRVYWLPTEAQWEYACRAGSIAPYHFGDDDTTLGDYAWFAGNANRRTHPVGLKKPNAWGLYDMYGNVWEWCADSFGRDYYKRSPPKDPPGPPPNQFHIRRGGSWHTPGPLCRNAFRDNRNGNAYDMGLRVVCELPSEESSPGNQPPTR